ncbi:MAG: glycosyltransferase [Candidatus Omnitrophota bacterium]
MQQKELSINWICPNPSPYNNYLFRALSADTDINLEVYFCNKSIPSHPWVDEAPEGFKHRYCKNSFLVKAELVKKALGSKRCIFVLSGWNKLIYWTMLIILMLKKRPYIIWTDTPSIAKNRMWAKRKVRSIWLKNIFNRALAVMSTGNPGVETLEKIGCPTKKIVNFPCWVPLLENSEFQEKGIDKKIRFFAIGRLNLLKRHELTIKAFSEVSERFKEKNIELWIFGDGPERKSLEALSKKLGIEKKVKFYGWCKSSFIQSKIMEADVLLHPSLWDAYGVAVLEAMAHGKPVIASDATMAALDRVRQGNSGFIFKKFDTLQLAEYMSFFISHPEKIEIMGKEARKTAQAWPVERASEILKNIINKQTA